MCRQWQLPWSRMERSSSQGYGIRTFGGNDAVDADTVFPIASITKAFTATAMAMLVDEGKVDWMDCVTKHLPEFQLRDPWLTREVRIADLLSHRTGLEDPDHSSGEFDRAELIRRTRFLPRRAISIWVLLQQHGLDRCG